MTDSQIRAVAFDVDGTLYANRRMYLASLPLVLRHTALFRAFAGARREVRRMGCVADIPSFQAEFVADRLGCTVAWARRAIDRVIYGAWERGLRRVPLRPGTRDLLRWLREHGYLVGALSDFPVVDKLTRFGIAASFDRVLNCEETGCLKPHPRPLLELCDRLGVQADQVLYVGNSARYDLGVARAAGAHGLLIRAFSFAQHATHSVAALPELTGRLQRV